MEKYLIDIEKFINDEDENIFDYKLIKIELNTAYFQVNKMTFEINVLKDGQFV